MIDEFTSYLDRETAQKVAKGVNDYIYRNKSKKVILIACHFDIIGTNYLQPSFIVDFRSQQISFPVTPNINQCGKWESKLHLLTVDDLKPVQHGLVILVFFFCVYILHFVFCVAFVFCAKYNILAKYKNGVFLVFKKKLCVDFVLL